MIRVYDSNDDFTWYPSDGIIVQAMDTQTTAYCFISDFVLLPPNFSVNDFQTLHRFLQLEKLSFVGENRQACLPKLIQLAGHFHLSETVVERAVHDSWAPWLMSDKKVAIPLMYELFKQGFNHTAEVYMPRISLPRDLFQKGMSFTKFSRACYQYYRKRDYVRRTKAPSCVCGRCRGIVGHCSMPDMHSGLLDTPNGYERQVVHYYSKGMFQ